MICNKINRLVKSFSKCTCFLIIITISNILHAQQVNTSGYQQFTVNKICAKNYKAYGKIGLSDCINNCNDDNNCMGVHFSQQRLESDQLNVNSCYTLSKSTCSGIKHYDVSDARDFTLYKKIVADNLIEGTVCLTDEHCGSGSLKCIKNECYGDKYTKFPTKKICRKNYQPFKRIDITTCLDKCNIDNNCMGIHFSHQRYLANDDNQNSCYTISQSTCSGIKHYDVSNARDFTIYKKKVPDNQIEGTVCLTDEHCGPLKCIKNECYGDKYIKFPTKKICKRNYKKFGILDITKCLNKCEEDNNCIGIHFSHQRFLANENNNNSCYTLSQSTCSDGFKHYDVSNARDFTIYKKLNVDGGLENTICITSNHCGSNQQCIDNKCKKSDQGKRRGRREMRERD